MIPMLFLRLSPAVILLAGLPFLPGTARALEPSEVTAWHADLDTLSARLVATHPHPFHSVPADSFRLEMESLKRRLPEMRPHEVVVDLARIVARIGEGHTRVTLPLDPSHGFFQGHARTAAPRDSRLRFHACPIRLHLFEDGLFVRRIDSRHGRLAGARVVSIGRLPVDAAMEAVTPVAHRDNASQLRSILPEYLVVPEILAARGIIDSAGGPVRFGLLVPDGSEESVELAGLLDSSGITWTDALQPEIPAPLWLQKTDEMFWFETLPDQRAVYFQYNQVANSDKETLAAFVDRLFAVVNGPGVDRLVIDLRHNPGGNGSLNRPLLHAIIRSEKLREPGSFFVLTGPRTFSAAMFLVLDLETHTPALFVGETTGGNPNSHGDSKRIVLPNSGITVRVSSLYWQPSDPRDRRQGVPPHLPVTMTSADYRRGRDPVLEAALSFFGEPATPATLEGTWSGPASIDFSRVEMTLALKAAPTGGLEGTITSGPFALNETPVRNLAVELPNISFGATTDQVTLAVRGRLGSRRLAGWVLTGGMAFPLVLERQ